MHTTDLQTRRRFMVAASITGLMLAQPALAQQTATPTPVIKVWKDPGCGCCGGWVEHLKAAGFTVSVVETAHVRAQKDRLNVPAALASCHTAEIAGYVIEGHVPAHAIQRLLAEKPSALGLAVPGMPTGSPGMEGGTPVTYDVVIFTKTSQQSFGRYNGSQPV